MRQAKCEWKWGYIKNYLACFIYPFILLANIFLKFLMFVTASIKLLYANLLDFLNVNYACYFFERRESTES